MIISTFEQLHPQAFIIRIQLTPNTGVKPVRINSILRLSKVKSGGLTQTPLADRVALLRKPASRSKAPQQLDATSSCTVAKKLSLCGGARRRFSERCPIPYNGITS